MEPQYVVIGKPNCGVVKPSGTGAGVVCSFASFAAKKRPEPAAELVDETAERPKFRKSVARKAPWLAERAPWAWLDGQREGTIEWIALRDVCSPFE